MNEGAKWIEKSLKVQLSPLGVRVAELLDDVFAGIYHISKCVSEADWANNLYIDIRYGGSFSTYDFDKLTQLVFAAHHYAIRIEISPRSNKYLTLTFHGRQRGGRGFERHPTIEEAVARWNDSHKVEAVAQSAGA